MNKYIIGLSVFFAFAASAHAKDYVLTLKDNKFSPSELTVPAGEKVKITVKNQDATPAEFESHDLRVEKVVSGHGQIIVSVGPLTAGSYSFYDEYHEDTATGTIVVK